MFASKQRGRANTEGPAVDIAPLIDVVFILLIFFLVSSTFVKDTGVQVNRAEAVSAQSHDALSLRLGISARGNIFTAGEQVDLSELSRRVSHAKLNDDLRSVLVIPDRDCSAGRLIEVMDAVRQAGISDVAIAAERRR